MPFLPRDLSLPPGMMGMGMMGMPFGFGMVSPGEMMLSTGPRHGFSRAGQADDMSYERLVGLGGGMVQG